MQSLKPLVLISCQLLIASIGATGCGSGASERESSSSGLALSADSDLSAATVSASLSEGLDSLSDSNLLASAGTALRSPDLELANSNTVTKTCEASGSKALVTIDHERSSSWEKLTKRLSLSAETSISQNIERTWSQADKTIACSGKRASIDFESDLSGLTLDVKVNREATRSFTRELLKSGIKSVSSSKATVSGTRQIQWLSQSAAADGGISREKTISMSVQRSIDLTNKQGEAKSLVLSVSTKADAPLAVTTTWDKLSKGRTLISKLIKSGTLKASSVGKGSVETSFSNVLLRFDAAGCEIYSGSLEAKVFAEGASSPSQIIKLTAEEGEVTAVDASDSANPKEIEDFEYSPCDLKDFQD